jgi:hypothetical protein
MGSESRGRCPTDLVRVYVAKLTRQRRPVVLLFERDRAFDVDRPEAESPRAVLVALLTLQITSPSFPKSPVLAAEVLVVLGAARRLVGSAPQGAGLSADTARTMGALEAQHSAAAGQWGRPRGTFLWRAT